MWFPHIAIDFVFVLDLVILYFSDIRFRWYGSIHWYILVLKVILKKQNDRVLYSFISPLHLTEDRDQEQAFEKTGNKLAVKRQSIPPADERILSFKN